MLRSPLLRLHQTASHLIPTSITRSSFSTTIRLKQNDMGDRPNGTIATKGLELLTFGTPNGHKASIVLEELKEAYGKPDYVSTLLGKRVTRSTWFPRGVLL
jgi:glutathione S-transferase